MLAGDGGAVGGAVGPEVVLEEEPAVGGGQAVAAVEQPLRQGLAGQGLAGAVVAAQQGAQRGAVGPVERAGTAVRPVERAADPRGIASSRNGSGGVGHIGAISGIASSRRESASFLRGSGSAAALGGGAAARGGSATALGGGVAGGPGGGMGKGPGGGDK